MPIFYIETGAFLEYPVRSFQNIQNFLFLDLYDMVVLIFFVIVLSMPIELRLDGIIIAHKPVFCGKEERIRIRCFPCPLYHEN